VLLAGAIMDKDRVAAALAEIGTLLELQGESAFRCQAYHNGARAIEALEADLATLVAGGRLGEVRGIGDTLKEKITTLVKTGALPFLDDLRSKTPPGLLQMLRIPGLGPKKVKALYDQLHIDTLDALKSACAAGRVASLKGFGEKTQEKILSGIAFVAESGQRVRLDQALSIALALKEGVAAAPGVIRIELCGSIRRRKETIKDIDILVSSNDAAPIMDRFVSLPGVVQLTGRGDTKASVVVNAGTAAVPLHINSDLRVVSDAQFPFALHYFTGSKEHCIAMRVLAQKHGLKLNEYGLTGSDRTTKCKTEADIFGALGQSYIPPELREDTGEMEAAATDALPHLLELDDIRGVFHCHTTESDGAATLEEMARAAKALGLKYLGIGDHSQSLTVANGLTPARVRRQQAAIDALNEHLKGFRVFKGTECDILPDGRLDFDDELLATFDYVVASVHSHFNQSREEMTARIVRAVRHPAVTMLGHATGRLLLRREAYPLDLEAVLRAAAESGTLIEINAHPQRLDLDWVHCKRAKALGVQLVINPDAHSTADLALYSYGVDVARRGWLTKEDILNTKSTAEVAKTLAARKEAKGVGV
jgi:DNA polymerase (family 10)